MIDCDYYKDYIGPDLVKATLDNKDDFTQNLINIMVSTVIGMGNYIPIRRFLEKNVKVNILELISKKINITIGFMVIYLI